MKGYATTEAAGEESMKYSLEPCGERDAELIRERAFEDLPTGDAEQELIVLKAVGADGAFLGGCVLDIDEMKTAEFASFS